MTRSTFTTKKLQSTSRPCNHVNRLPLLDIQSVILRQRNGPMGKGSYHSPSNQTASAPDPGPAWHHVHSIQQSQGQVPQRRRPRSGFDAGEPNVTAANQVLFSMDVIILDIHNRTR